jgi:hypothetical protein
MCWRRYEKIYESNASKKEIKLMPRTTTTYDLLLSCPGDVYETCIDVVKSAVDEFNKFALSNLSISINLKHWSTDSYPQSGGNPQELLNAQIVDNADAAVAIFWTRFGTPTDKYGSGTEEEISRLIDSNKQVFLYFFNKPVPPNSINSSEYERVLAFKDKYKGEGIYGEIADESELKERFSRHLAFYFTSLNASDAGMVKANEKSKLTLTTREYSHSVIIQHLNLCAVMGLQTQKEALIARIEKANENALLRMPQRSPVMTGVLKSTFPLTSFKTATISESEVDIVTKFCVDSGISLSPNFWNFDGLQIGIQKLILYDSEKVYSGSDESIQAYEAIREIVTDVFAFTDTEKYYREFDSFGFIELFIRNEGTAFDEDIEISLTLPHGVLLEKDDFPVPMYELEHIIEDDSIQEWLCPAITADIDAFDYSYSAEPFIPNHLPSVFPFGNVDYEKEYEEQKEKYYSMIEELLDWAVYPQEDVDTIRIKIKTLNQHKTMNLPARLFLKKPVDRIEYRITAKHTTDIIQGQISVVSGNVHKE